MVGPDSPTPPTPASPSDGNQGIAGLLSPAMEAALVANASDCQCVPCQILRAMFQEVAKTVERRYHAPAPNPQ